MRFNEKLDCVLQFLDDIYRIGIIDKQANPERLYYLKRELTRTFNTLHYIARKTARPLVPLIDFDASRLERILPFLIYITFRIRREKASQSEILDELNELKECNSHSEAGTIPLRTIINTLQTLPNSAIKGMIKRIITFNFSKALNGKSEIERWSIRHSMPGFLLERVLPHMGSEHLKTLIESWDVPYPQAFFTIRIRHNERSPIFSHIMNELKERGIPYVPDPHFPTLLHIPNPFKPQLTQHPYFKRWFLIHDKASFISAALLEANRGDVIWDMAAAPGIKSLCLWDLAPPRIIASDLSSDRIHKSPIMGSYIQDETLPTIGEYRTTHLTSNALNINPLVADSRNPPFATQQRQFDKILLDAPCTGSGTLYSTPILKWRQSYEFLRRNMKLQRALLLRAVAHLKPGGILVYTTCSLYREEGEDRIIKLLAEVPDMEPYPFPEQFRTELLSPAYFFPEKCRGVELDSNLFMAMGRIFPNFHEHMTMRDIAKYGYTQSGFFYARLRKREKK